MIHQCLHSWIGFLRGMLLGAMCLAVSWHPALSQTQILDRPLNLRNVFGLVILNSSVNNQAQGQVPTGGGEQGTADRDISFFIFGGGFLGNTAFHLDGAWNTADG